MALQDNADRELEKELLDKVRFRYGSVFYDRKSIRAIPLHYDYLRKLFKKEMGRSTLEYLTDLRMNRARELLLDGTRKLPIAEVAEGCGFSDALYFSRVFKKRFGSSPTQFRQSAIRSKVTQ